MKTKDLERDASLSAAYVAIAACGVLFLVGSAVSFGSRVSAAVALGVTLALANLWVLERVVRAFLENSQGRWALIGLLKASALFAVVALLVKSGAVDVLPLIIGFGALPLGVVLGGLFPVPSARGES